MRILVVGGAGYIGSVTVAELLSSGHEVTVLDNLSTGHRRGASPGAELVVAPLEDGERLDSVFRERRPEAVVYYGGFIAAGESMEQPGRYFANNIIGVITLLNAMAAHGVRRFVFSSSAAVYGDPAPPHTRGEDPRPETHLIPRLLHVALGRGERFELYGTDYPTPDGTCIRDYIHVSDLA